MKSKMILITGTSTGIGEASALYLDARGLRVLAGVRREEDGARLREKGSANLSTVLIDVTIEDSIARAAEDTARACGEAGLDGLVNNAGINVSSPLELCPLPELRRQFEVNVFGQVAVAQAFLPLLRRAQGRIVNMSSISGRMAGPLLGPYAMSKFALEAFSDSLRQELHPWGIHVSSVEPGRIATPIWEKSLKAAMRRHDSYPAEARARYSQMVEGVRKWAVKTNETAIPAEKVARAVHHALTSSKPKTRYVVGTNAKITALLSRFLPDRLLDKITRRYLGL